MQELVVSVNTVRSHIKSIYGKLNVHRRMDVVLIKVADDQDEVYVHKRIHSSLGYLTLAEFEAQWLQQQALPRHVH